MRSAATFIKTHPVLTYFAVAFAISWGGALVAIGAGGMRGTTPASDPRFPYALMAMLAGPSLTGILLTALLYGPAGLRGFLARVRRWRVGAQWYAAALLIAPLAMSATLLALSFTSTGFFPGILTSNDKASLLLISLAVAVSAGIFEELGWTGFAIPALRQRYSVFRTGVVVGIWWSAWHLLPNVWASRAASGELAVSVFMTATAVGIFVGYLTAFRILMVWVYDRTESLFVAMLMHVSLTASLLILNPLEISGAHLVTYSFAFAAAVWIVVAVVAAVHRRTAPVATSAEPSRVTVSPMAMKHPGRTPPFHGPDGKPVPGSIAEIEYLRLGGVDQWVMMRGERLGNPPLVLLHGGPGFSETHFFRRFNAPLETSFTVVYWDQRGAGKSFDRSIPRSSMSIEQFISDLDELVDVVRTRVGQDKVTLFGHSWGSALGVLYAARFPDKVALYVGCEQVGDWAAAEAASYAFALGEAHRRNDTKAFNALRAIGPPPYSSRSLFIERTWLSRFDGQRSVRALWKMGRDFLRCPESSIVDLPDIVRGFRFSLDAMWPELSTLNLVTLVPALRMPVFFFLGRRDHWVPPETSVAYFQALTAPAKKLVWFEESGHEPFVDEPAKFNTAMVDLVRPAVGVAAASGLRRTG